MPGFSFLTDAQLAEISSYARKKFAGNSSAISEDDVRIARKQAAAP
jgi:mono/diheme cytochrome c family protein